MHRTGTHSTTRTITAPRRGSRASAFVTAATLAAVAGALVGCAPQPDDIAPVFASSPASESDQAVTAACWRVANAMSLATNAQRGLDQGRWQTAEATGAYRAAARILDYIPVPASSPVALPLIALQELVDAPGAAATEAGLDPADPVWQSTISLVIATCVAEGVPVSIDEWTP